MNNFKLLFPKIKAIGYYIIEDIVNPIEHISLFKDLYICMSNCDSNMIKKNIFYSISTKIEFIETRQNVIIITKKVIIF